MREKAILDHISAISGAEEKGRAEGRDEGNRETAKRLLDMGMPVSDIAKAMGLSEMEVRQMQCH